MNRNADFHLNRTAIINAFREMNFTGLDNFMQLAVMSNTDRWEIDNNYWNLEFEPQVEKFRQLSDLDPQSDESVDLICEIAANDGRPETAIALLGHCGRSDFSQQAAEFIRQSGSPPVFDIYTSWFHENWIDSESYRLSDVQTLNGGGSDVLSYTDGPPNQLYLQSIDNQTVLGVMKRATPVQTIAASGWAFLGDMITEPVECRLVLMPHGTDPVTVIGQDSIGPAAGDSGWCRISFPQESLELQAQLNVPSQTAMDLVLAVRRSETEKPGKVLGGFSAMKYVQAIGDTGAKRPRVGAPPTRQLSREWTEDERQSVKLISDYRDELPLILLPPEGQGIFLRPSSKGTVVATIENGYPPLARRLIGRVEIAHEEASPFEFAMALTTPGKDVDWRGERPKQCLTYSGWCRVTNTFELHDIVLDIDNRAKIPLNINLAIRLPRGSSPSPANAFWRKLLFQWDD